MILWSGKVLRKWSAKILPPVPVSKTMMRVIWYIIYMFEVKKKKNETKAEVLQEVGVNTSDIIRGKWFPDGPVKEGTRWFYVICLIIALLGVAGMIASGVFIWVRMTGGTGGF